jgi:hypothetical protein
MGEVSAALLAARVCGGFGASPCRPRLQLKELSRSPQLTPTRVRERAAHQGRLPSSLGQSHSSQEIASQHKWMAHC